jgi:hypothetical protein
MECLSQLPDILIEKTNKKKTNKQSCDAAIIAKVIFCTISCAFDI